MEHVHDFTRFFAEFTDFGTSDIFKRALGLLKYKLQLASWEVATCYTEMCSVTLSADYTDKVLANGFRPLANSIILPNIKYYIISNEFNIRLQIC